MYWIMHNLLGVPFLLVDNLPLFFNFYFEVVDRFLTVFAYAFGNHGVISSHSTEDLRLVNVWHYREMY